LFGTGAEINLIRKGIVGSPYLAAVKRPLRIAAANQATMHGGEHEVHSTITLTGMGVDTGEERTLLVTTSFYVADIGVDAILSYEWLATYDFVVNPRRNALLKKIPDTSDVVAIHGKHVVKTEVASATRVDTPMVMPLPTSRPEKRTARQTPLLKMPKIYRMLDLFSGTGSVGNVFRSMGYQVVSVDFDARRKPSIVVDIAVWQYWKIFQPQFFDVIACCPPCTEFSRAINSQQRDFEKPNRLV